MQIVWGFFLVITGVLFIWMGSFAIIANMLPHKLGMYVAEKHGEWVRENVLHLPPPSHPRNKEVPRPPPQCGE